MLSRCSLLVTSERRVADKLHQVLPIRRGGLKPVFLGRFGSDRTANDAISTSRGSRRAKLPRPSSPLSSTSPFSVTFYILQYLLECASPMPSRDQYRAIRTDSIHLRAEVMHLELEAVGEGRQCSVKANIY